ncbi:MAG TPA: lysine-2,3-aminomutase-like protein [Xanthobacteraceae bacterium]|jgi:lysine 2,3-aminomutase|nr:lysine-2,3-aminomutase-like protein [Xanthobacteraceae bacterium]
MPTTHRGAAGLLAAGLARPEKRSELERIAARYAVSLTADLAALIDPADAERGRDPIARQFLPDPAELDQDAAESVDPIGDDAHSPIEGIVHRYPDRVLLKLTHVCAVYCRFCFRREMVGPSRRGALSPAAVDAALGYIRERPEIWEVILTGGDPLILSARRLRCVMEALARIDHVKVVRVHTRVPVAAAALITPAMVRALKASGKATYVLVHVNHPRELTAQVRAACARLIDAGIPMLSQSVLLRGVNDDADTLAALLRALVECRIKPYYLHHGDLAPGTSHLRTTVACGQGLMRALRGRVSGLCQPTYVLDIPGGHGKSPIGPSYIGAAAEGDVYEVEDFNGGRHIYPPRTARR